MGKHRDKLPVPIHTRQTLNRSTNASLSHLNKYVMYIRTCVCVCLSESATKSSRYCRTLPTFGAKRGSIKAIKNQYETLNILIAIYMLKYQNYASLKDLVPKVNINY